MRTAEEILREHGSVCRNFPDPTCSGCICNTDLAAIRAAQVDAAEWMREEAAKATERFEGLSCNTVIGSVKEEKQAMLRDLTRYIRAIKLPGETI